MPPPGSFSAGRLQGKGRGLICRARKQWSTAECSVSFCPAPLPCLTGSCLPSRLRLLPQVGAGLPAALLVQLLLPAPHVGQLPGGHAHQRGGLPLAAQQPGQSHQANAGLLPQRRQRRHQHRRAAGPGQRPMCGRCGQPACSSLRTRASTAAPPEALAPAGRSGGRGPPALRAALGAAGPVRPGCSLAARRRRRASGRHCYCGRQLHGGGRALGPHPLRQVIPAVALPVSPVRSWPQAP